MFNKLKQIKEMKKAGKDMQGELATITNEGAAMWGKVKITVNGNRDVIDVIIEQDALEDAQKLSEAVKEAFKNATGKKFQLKLAKKMQDMGGLDMLKNLGG